MGLAASQARFLGLTARKSNIEYQGQQINQARTALSNEVMGLYQKYNSLDVPTPPSINDFTKTVYKIDSTYENYEISSFTKIAEGEYKGYYNVNLTYDREIAQAYTYAAKNSVITAQKNGDDYTYLNFQIGANSYVYKAGDTDNSSIVKITKEDGYQNYPGLTTIMQAHGLTDGTFYAYKMGNTYYYTSQDDLDATDFDIVDDKKVYNGTYSFDYQGAKTQTETVAAIAALTQASSGRLSEISIIASDDAPELVGSSYSITTSTEDDQKGYEDAMNQYNYDKSVYEKRVKEINMKTEKIQTEDKSLELKLSQLDTEQNAIATEMESISKVIEDTIDSVFKTFNS